MDPDVAGERPAAERALERLGRYELRERIGKGAMGLVYRAVDTALHRAVAVKVMIAELDAEPETRARFFREAQAAGKLAHRSIITILDVGEENDRAYIVMELLEGENLGEFLRRRPGLALESKLEIMMQVCDGLAFAHQHGVVHRDIKPANLFIQRDGQVKILDFGIARLAASTMTKSGFIIGTPEYMSPEQVQGRRVDQRTDIFSAGSVFYEMLGSAKPFHAAALPQILTKIVSEEPVPLDQFRADVPAELSAIILRALAKQPEARYQDFSDMLADLGRFTRNYDAETRKVAIATRARYREVEALLEERRAARRRAGREPLFEDVAIRPALEALPQFSSRGPDVLVAGSMQRVRLTAWLAELEAQQERLQAEMAPLGDWLALVDEAQHRLSSGDARGAIEYAERAVVALPASGEVQMLLATCRRRLETEIKTAARVDQCLADAQNALARGDWASALARLSEVLAEAPDDPRATALRRSAVRAREEAERVRSQQVARAIERVDRALRRGDLAEAERAIEEARQFGPELESVQRAAARVKEAQAIVEACQTRDRRELEAVESARERSSRGEHTAAIESLAKFLAAEPDCAIAREVLARLREERARQEQAARRQAEVASRLAACRAAYDAGRFEEVLIEVDRVFELEPRHAGASDLAARAKARLREAEEAARRAAEIAESLARAQESLAAGALKKAEEAAERVLALDPGHDGALKVRAEARQRREEQEAAEIRARAAAVRARHRRKTAEPFWKQARRAAAKGDDERALQAAENAYTLDSGFIEARKLAEECRRRLEARRAAELEDAERTAEMAMDAPAAIDPEETAELPAPSGLQNLKLDLGSRWAALRQRIRKAGS